MLARRILAYCRPREDAPWLGFAAKAALALMGGGRAQAMNSEDVMGLVDACASICGGFEPAQREEGDDDVAYRFPGPEATSRGACG